MCVGMRVKQQGRGIFLCGWTNSCRRHYWIRSREVAGSDELQDYQILRGHLSHSAPKFSVRPGSSGLCKVGPFLSVTKAQKVLLTAAQLGKPRKEWAHRFSSGLSKSHLSGSIHNFDQTAVGTIKTTKIYQRILAIKGKHAVVEEWDHSNVYFKEIGFAQVFSLLYPKHRKTALYLQNEKCLLL